MTEKTPEDALFDSGKLFKTIFENSAVAIMIADKNERLKTWNRLAEFLTGYTSEDLSMKEVAHLYPPEEWERLRRENIREKGMQHHFETRMMRKDGHIIDVDISITVLKDDKGQILGSIGIARDISQKKKIEAILVKAKEAAEKANRVKGAFLLRLSKEMVTPMGELDEAVQKLQTVKLPPGEKDVIAEVTQSASRLKTMVDEFYSIFKELKEERFLKVD